MRHETINPEVLGAPKGYANGVLAVPGRLLFVAGQVGADADGRVVAPDFAGQFERALANVLAVVKQAGGRPEDICRFTMYATDRGAYLSSLKEVGAAYRTLMQRHYPAMALVEVSALVLDDAMIEIEATAVIPEARGGPQRPGPAAGGRDAADG